MRPSFFIAITFLFYTLLLPPAYASDLDDGISSYTDDGIAKWDELGKKDRNVTFIKMDAKSKANVRAGGANAGVVTGTSGAGNMNSVVLGAGGNVRGDIIIIDESRGDKTQVVE